MIHHRHRQIPKGKNLEHGTWYKRGTNIQLGKKIKETANAVLVQGSKPYTLKPSEKVKIVDTDIESALVTLIL